MVMLRTYGEYTLDAIKSARGQIGHAAPRALLELVSYVEELEKLTAERYQFAEMHHKAVVERDALLAHAEHVRELVARVADAAQATYGLVEELWKLMPEWNRRP